jgi:hypothetical protein
MSSWPEPYKPDDIRLMEAILFEIKELRRDIANYAQNTLVTEEEVNAV